MVNDDKRPWRTINVRIGEEIIKELDDLAIRFNMELKLVSFGHRHTRADVLRTVIREGIEALKVKMGPPPPSKPTSPEEPPA